VLLTRPGEPSQDQGQKSQGQDQDQGLRSQDQGQDLRSQGQDQGFSFLALRPGQGQDQGLTSLLSSNETKQ
jgi:hypothetical protein